MRSQPIWPCDTEKHTCRDGQSISVPADMAAVLRSLQLGLKGEAASSSQGLSSEDDQARVRGFLQELSQVTWICKVLGLLVTSSCPWELPVVADSF